MERKYREKDKNNELTPEVESALLAIGADIAKSKSDYTVDSVIGHYMQLKWLLNSHKAAVKEDSE